MEKTCEFINANEMQVAALAEEVHKHTKKVNEYENGKLTVAQQKNLNAILEQISTMNITMNSMKLAITQTFQPLPHAPLLAVGNAQVGDGKDTPAPVTGSRSRQIEEDGTLEEACATKKPNIPNKINLKPKELFNIIQWIVESHRT